MSVPNISPQELKRRLEAGESLQVLDVREPWEWAIVHLPDSLHVPLQELPRRLQELPKDRPIVALCKVGGRSRRAAEFLSGQGFQGVANLEGGIEAWRAAVDPSLPSY